MGMKRIYHPEEDRQFGLVWDYDNEHSDAVYEIVFSNGECYRAVYFTAFESDNAGELDIEMDDPRYDEFHVLVFEVRESMTVRAGTTSTYPSTIGTFRRRLSTSRLTPSSIHHCHSSNTAA